MRRLSPFFALVLSATVNCHVREEGLAAAETPRLLSDAAVVASGGSVSTGTGGSIGGAVDGGGGLSTGGTTASDSAAVPDGNVDTPVPQGGAGSSSLDGAVASGGVVAAGGAVATGGVTSTGGSAPSATGGSPGAGSAAPDAAARSDAPADAQEASDTKDSVDTATSDNRLKLLWSDEFDSPTVSGVDASKWSHVTWDPGQVNKELQKYTNRLDNVFEDGQGHLVLRALNTPYNGFQYTSGRIETKDKFSFKFGRIEVRAKLPAGTGSFPGIVLLGTTGNWPQCGELALMEQYGQDKSIVYSSAYTGGGPSSGAIAAVPYTFDDHTTASSDFHLYALDWHPDQIAFQIDGEEVARSTFGMSSPFYTIPEYLVLDVALGGTMGGTIKSDQFPMEMIVDYVRVYSFQ